MNQTVNELFSKAESGALILTANNRLSRYLLSEYERWQVARGKDAWLRPAIMPFTVWCRSRYMSLDSALPVISEVQGNYVWEALVADSIRETSHELLQVAATARLAWKAEKLLLRYDCSFNPEGLSEDQAMFLHWRSRWHSRLESLNMVDADALPLLLSQSIDLGLLELPEMIVFTGFDEFDPSVLKLQESLVARGVTIHNHSQQRVPKVQRSCIQCSDPAAEVRAAVLKIKKIKEQNQDCRIGLVAPRLELYRDHIEKQFRTEFAPHTALFVDDTLPPITISVANRLDSESVICAAFRLLSVANWLPVDDLAWLLRTPYIARSISSRFKRAASERQLRGRRQALFPLQRLGSVLKSIGSDDAFIRSFELLQGSLRKKGAQGAGNWAEHFSDLLSAVGWPGERSLSSREYQAVERFKGLLGEFASLDQVCSGLSRSEAVSRLQKMAAAVEFQPKGGDSGLQAVGMLEAAGMQFDLLWILGLHAGALPRKPQPNPFIPIPLQRQMKMPHADAERERLYADNLISRLFSAAEQVVASWPAQEEGMALLVSRYLDGLPTTDLPDAESSDPSLLIRSSDVTLEKIVDLKAPSVVSRKVISGGTRIVQDQALCPFRAFAHHRLRAEAFDESDIGIDAMTRGRLVHGLLERFWLKTVDHASLIALDDQDLKQRLNESAEEAIRSDEERSRRDLPARQRLIERDRIVRLAGRWLDIERERPSFTVWKTEAAHTEVIGRLQFKTVVDRIDRCESGALAIIDYKTGQPKPEQWFDDRVTEPQLPIYCQQLDNSDIGAVLFAIVRPGERGCRFSGVARSPDDWPGLRARGLQQLFAERNWSDFDDLLNNWQQVLPSLADAFIEGDARIEPVDAEKACRYCDLQPLCRIFEQEMWVEVEA